MAANITVNIARRSSSAQQTSNAAEASDGLQHHTSRPSVDEADSNDNEAPRPSIGSAASTAHCSDGSTWPDADQQLKWQLRAFQRQQYLADFISQRSMSPGPSTSSESEMTLRDGGPQQRPHFIARSATSSLKFSVKSDSPNYNPPPPPPLHSTSTSSTLELQSSGSGSAHHISSPSPLNDSTSLHRLSTASATLSSHGDQAASTSWVTSSSNFDAAINHHLRNVISPIDRQSTSIISNRGRDETQADMAPHDDLGKANIFDKLLGFRPKKGRLKQSQASRSTSNLLTDIEDNQDGPGIVQGMLIDRRRQPQHRSLIFAQATSRPPSRVPSYRLVRAALNVTRTIPTCADFWNSHAYGRSSIVRHRKLLCSAVGGRPAATKTLRTS
jgi:hypothetical protein